MAATVENGAIKFSYTADTLFNDVGLISAFMTKNLQNEKGSLLDEFAITSDEREVFDVCVNQTLPNIFDEMLKMSANVTGIENKDGNIILSVRDNNSYNDNALTLVDMTIYDCLKYGVLKEFYSICVHADLLGLAQSKYAEMLHLLNKRIVPLKMRSISSLY